MTGWSPLIVATRSVVDALTRDALLKKAFLGIKMARWRLQFVAARNLAMKGAVEFLEPVKHLVVPRLSVRVGCRNHKWEMFIPKV